MRRAARNLQLPDVYGASYGGLQLDRPMLVTEAEASRFGDDLRALLDLLVDLPGRLVGGDLAAFCTRIGMHPDLAELVTKGAEQPLPRYGRADAYHDGEGFRVLELNVGSEVGGIDTAQLNRAYLEVPAFAEFAAAHDLTFVDPLPRVADLLRSAGAAVTDAEPTVALIECNGGLAAHEHVFAAIQEAMATVGIRLLLGELDDLGSRGGKVTLRDEPVDVILRYFVAGELVSDASGRRALELILDAEGTALFTPLSAAAFASKAALGLLHDPAVRSSGLSSTERALVDRIVPWTRMLSPGVESGTDPGDLDELVERCRSEREDLVVKPGTGYGGVGTVVGHDVSDDEWAAVLHDATAGGRGDLVVQRRVRPATETVLDADTGEPSEWVANWGLFVDPDGHAGGFVRALRPEHGAIVSYSNKETRGTCVFTTPS
ncbi:hypothetical protein BJF85_11485 [Saccharomonospora sp. CUA-673]|nr:hypothetical protein BJF85_11485 [Saccharomonospora sp. CUA-673]